MRTLLLFLSMIRLKRFFRIIYRGLMVSVMIVLSSKNAVAIKRESIHFESIMGNDELPNLSVNAIYQDHYGLIWVGTNDGLVCYDGDSYKVYKYSSSNPHSLSSKRIMAIAEGKDGILWINTFDGLNRFNRYMDNFDRFPLDDKFGNSLTSGGTGILFDSRGRVLISSIAGVPIFDPTTETWNLSYTAKTGFVKDIQSLGEDNFLIAAATGFHQVNLSTGTQQLLKETPINGCNCKSCHSGSYF
jgi:hypothetical protein